MTDYIRRDLVIALDYYDGEAEGFAHCEGECSYFMRTRVDEDDANEYECVAMQCSFFDGMVESLEIGVVLGEVFVYSGNNDGINQQLEEILPVLRSRLQSAGYKVFGRNYLDAARKGPVVG